VFPADNTIVTSGTDRKFKLILPAAPRPGERLALIVLWHWLGGNADQLVEALELQAAADQERFIAVVPVSKGDLLFRWPFSLVDSGDRLDEEIKFFDDLLACVAAAHPEVNPGCVASLGVSAGALFNDQLAPRRSDRLASFISLSGGVGTTARDWDGAGRKLPGLVLWGGPDDNYKGLFDFTKASGNLEDDLTSEGHFFVECVHNCGHAVPPFVAPPGRTRFAPLWQFVRDHPFWVAPGTSPWKPAALPALFPDWCGLGKGGAVPRTDPGGC